jgi:hypothetical protein
MATEKVTITPAYYVCFSSDIGNPRTAQILKRPSGWRIECWGSKDATKEPIIIVATSLTKAKAKAEAWVLKGAVL